MGVSATHLDWTMVPYVRKSFAKHFHDGLKYIEDGSTETDTDGLHFDHIPIDFGFYKKFPKAYQYALDMTQRELDQAVEGLYHNLRY